MPISAFVFAGWAFSSLVSVSSMFFLLPWPVIELRVSAHTGDWTSDDLYGLWYSRGYGQVWG